MIKAFFKDFQSNYNISFIDENIPLGTAGGLKYLEGRIDTPFFVSNCDIIIQCDYSKIYKFHKKANFDLTLVSSIQHHIIPYGVCKLENDGSLKNIKEKPEYNFLVNTGMYILNPDILQFIPKNKSFDITGLIKCLKEKKKRAGVYHISEKSWIDLGQWEEYSIVKKFGNLKEDMRIKNRSVKNTTLNDKSKLVFLPLFFFSKEIFPPATNFLFFFIKYHTLLYFQLASCLLIGR